MKEQNDKKILALTGGSTGGHVFPLLSVYNYLKEDKKYDFIWVGEEDSLEQDIAEENRIKFLDIPAGKIRRYFDIRNFYEPLKNLTGIFFGIYYIKKYKIDIVFSKGGYVALPLSLAAFILRKKIYIHESDTIGGLANRLIGKMATKVFYTFPNSKTESGNPKYILSGQILNPELLDSVKSLEIEENERLNVIIMGGSQGSTTIFEAMLKIIPLFEDVDFQVILGEKNLHFKNEFEKYDNVITYDFLSQKRVGKILTNIDIAITRGGATTLWELTLFGVHSIILPLKESAGNHQEENANYFKKNFGSDIIDETNPEEELVLKLKSYESLRKSGLNLGGFFNALKIIDSEIS